MSQGGSERRCSVFLLKEPNNIYSSIYCAHAAWNNRPLSKQTDKHAYSNAVCGNVSNVSSLISRPTDRREAVLLPALQQGVRRQVQSQGSPTNPFGCEKIPMQELLQNLLQDVSSAQAWGIWLLRSTLNWDTFPTTTKKKRTLLRWNFLFFFSKKRKRLSGNYTELVHSQDWVYFCFLVFFLFYFFYKWASSFISDGWTAFCSCAWQCSVFAAGLEHFMPCTRLPVLFMHFPACLDRFLFSHKVTYSSLCPCLSNGCYTVLHTFLSFFKKMFYNMIPKNNLMNDSLKEFWSHGYAGNKCTYSARREMIQSIAHFPALKRPNPSQVPQTFLAMILVFPSICFIYWMYVWLRRLYISSANCNAEWLLFFIYIYIFIFSWHFWEIKSHGVL